MLHALTFPSDPAAIELSERTMAATFALVDYLRAHLHRVASHFGVTAQLQDPLSARVLRAIERNGGSATTNDLHQALKSRKVQAATLHAALTTLQRSNLIAGQPTNHAGAGRTGMRWSLSQTAQEETQDSPHSTKIRDSWDSSTGVSVSGVEKLNNIELSPSKGQQETPGEDSPVSPLSMASTAQDGTASDQSPADDESQEDDEDVA